MACLLITAMQSENGRIKFPQHWIGKWEPVEWPPQSIDLLPLNKVYAQKVYSVHLQEPIVTAGSEITPQTIHAIPWKRENFSHICACINSGHIEHTLLTVASQLQYGPWFQTYRAVQVLLYNVIQMTVYHLIVKNKSLEYNVKIDSVIGVLTCKYKILHKSRTSDSHMPIMITYGLLSLCNPLVFAKILL
jgi:hypothetical protein